MYFKILIYIMQKPGQDLFTTERVWKIKRRDAEAQRKRREIQRKGAKTQRRKRI